MNQKLRWKTDFEKDTLINNFEKRGWVRNDDDWNIYWADVWTVRKIFNSDTGYRIGEYQLINHFPDNKELTKKDSMIKNIKQFRKDRIKDGSHLAERDDNGRFIYMDIVPLTYTLPQEYSVVIEEFKRNPNMIWIMKPSGSSQGKGIFLATKPDQIKKWAPNYKPEQRKETFVISQYIDNPLLVGGKKFDIRMYVLVTSYKPLKVYIHEKGFARFCTVKYSKNIAELDNLMVHATNVHLAKQSEHYNSKHGGKWELSNLKLYLQQIRGKEASDKCFEDINNMIYISLKAVQSEIRSDKHCFELYGYDVLIDDNLKPWLIEVNASPSLSATTKSDRSLKLSVLKDVFQIVVTPDWGEDKSKTGSNLCKEKQIGGFTLLIDESDATTDKKGKKTGGGGYGYIWI